MRNSSGNVLFLILIAVALFAALSYAITQSSRSSGGDASKEKNSLNAAALSTYMVSVRTGVQRMVMGGVAVTDLEFNPPSDFANCTSPSVCVFHPDGGGVVYENAPFGVSASFPSGALYNPNGLWIYNMNFEILNVGTSSASSLDGNDLVAFYVGIKKEVCEQINAKLGVTGGIPFTSSGNFADAQFFDPSFYMDNNYSLTPSEGVIGWSGWSLLGAHEGCLFQNDDKTYVYYAVILER